MVLNHHRMLSYLFAKQYPMGSVDAVERLLGQKGLNLDIQNRKGYTPLHLAIQSKRLEMVNLLLSHPRANVNCKGKDDNTPLWLSTYSSCDGITERLLAEKDININFVGVFVA